MTDNFEYANQKTFSFEIQPQIEFRPHYDFDNNKIVISKRKDQFLPNTERELSPLEEILLLDRENKKDITYKINEYGHRCDPFLTNHNATHILFAGCSITFGEGLPVDQTWSHYLYRKIKNKNKLSGYYNLSYTGGGIDIIVNNLFRYCEQFTNPDIIFILMPSLEREYIWWNDKYYLTMPKKNNMHLDHLNTKILHAYNNIRNLEIFCNKNNIKLLWSTWDNEDNKIFKDLNFKNFFSVIDNKIYDNVDYTKINDPYFQIARDRIHDGFAFSDGVSNVFFKVANEKNFF